MSEQATGRSIELETPVAASLDAIWRALSDAEELRRWFPLEARGTPGPGGELTVGWGDGDWTMKIAAWEPPHRLRLVSEAPTPDGTMVEFVVEWHVSGRDGDAVVRMVNSGFGEGAEWDEQIEGIEAGWSYFLLNLRHYLERHLGTPRDMVYARGEIQADDPVGRVLAETGGSDTARQVGAEYDLFMGATRRHGQVEMVFGTRTVAIHIPGLNDALLFIERESPNRVSLWLSTYGLDAATLDELRAWMEGVKGRLFGKGP